MWCYRLTEIIAGVFLWLRNTQKVLIKWGGVSSLFVWSKPDQSCLKHINKTCHGKRAEPGVRVFMDLLSLKYTQTLREAGRAGTALEQKELGRNVSLRENVTAVLALSYAGVRGYSAH